MAASDMQPHTTSTTAASDLQPQTTSTMAASHLHWLDVAKQDATRKKFLESIESNLNESELRHGISPRVWAFAMIVPVDKLTQHIDSLSSSMAPLIHPSLDTGIKTTLDAWKQRGTMEEPVDEDNNQPAMKKRKTASRATSRLTSSAPSEAASEATSGAASEATQQVTEQPSDVRAQTLATHCMERDNRLCILLRTIVPDAAHIIPYSLQRTLKKTETRKSDNRSWFWRVIEMMYTREEVQEIEKAAGAIGGAPINGLVQRVDNLLSLNNFAHRRWTMGHFAFEPIPRNPEDEDRKQSMIFHWLPTIEHSGTITAEKYPEHEESPANSSSGTSTGELLYRNDGKRIQSGERIDMTTNDPQRLPLPSYGLLRLQWDMQRLLHLSAGAEPLKLSDDSDDDDDGYDLPVLDSEYYSDEDEKIGPKPPNKRKWDTIQQMSDQSYDSGLGMASSRKLNLNAKATTTIRGMTQENIEESWEVV